MPASAKVNLATLAMNTTTDLNSAITRGTIGDITPQRLGSSTATEAVFEAIVPPHTGTAYTSRTFKFTVEGEVYTHPLPDTFDFVSGKAYGFELTLKGRGAPLDMSDDDGLANCYIVTPGTQSVPIDIERAITVGGMSPTATNITLVELWDDNDVIDENTGISALTVTGTSRTFTVTTTTNEGNAVVALKGDDDTIYWSWHIWNTTLGPEIVSKYLTFMDRNLGATANTNTLASRGLYYQWGRKDPFPSGKNGTAGQREFTKFVGITNVKRVTNKSNTLMGAKLGVLESIRKPLTFFKAAVSDGYNWLPYDADFLWETESHQKTVFDPCPSGWRTIYNGTFNGAWPYSGSEAEGGYYKFHKTLGELSYVTDDYVMYIANGYITHNGYEFSGTHAGYWGGYVYHTEPRVAERLNRNFADWLDVEIAYGGYAYGSLFGGGDNLNSPRFYGMGVRCTKI
jgi:hypothetical protein